MTDDILRRDQPDAFHMAVPGIIAIIAENKIHSFGDPYFFHFIGDLFRNIVFFLCDAVQEKLPVFDGISEGVKIIILTVVISLAAALIFPVKEDESDE